jgi:hypothetical protein
MFTQAETVIHQNDGHHAGLPDVMQITRFEPATRPSTS